MNAIDVMTILQGAGVRRSYACLAGCLGTIGLLCLASASGNGSVKS